MIHLIFPRVSPLVDLVSVFTQYCFVKAYFVCMYVQVHMHACVIEFVHMPVEATSRH